MEFKEITLNDTHSLLEPKLKDLHIVHLNSQVVANSVLHQHEHYDVPLEQSQQSMQLVKPSPSFLSSVPVKVPPSTTLAFNIAVPIPSDSSVVQSLIELDFGDALFYGGTS